MAFHINGTLTTVTSLRETRKLRQLSYQLCRLWICNSSWRNSGRKEETLYYKLRFNLLPFSSACLIGSRLLCKIQLFYISVFVYKSLQIVCLIFRFTHFVKNSIVDSHKFSVAHSVRWKIINQQFLSKFNDDAPRWIL